MPFFPVTTMSMAALSGFASILFLFEWDDPVGVRNYNTPEAEEFDYIIVGAGSTGSVVASRLSEDKDVSVLLLEAGSDGSYFTSIPGLQGLFYGGPLDWQFESEEQPYSCLGYEKRVCKWIRGRAIGGSSVLNGGVYMRGLRKDFDNWATMGNPGWSFREVLPFFKKSENNLEDDLVANTEYHNSGGPLKITRSKFRTPAGEAWLQTGFEEGYPVDDLNGFFQRGFMAPQITVDEFSRRESAATAFLEPIRDRENLHISPNSQVTRILIDDGKMQATGVEFFDIRRQLRSIRARKEVIISAGTVNTPKLLMLSGIGPSDELNNHGIPQLVDLPVGENLHGHSGVFGVSFTSERRSGFNAVRDMLANAFAPLQFFVTGRGPLAGLMGLEGVGLLPLKESPQDDWPELGFVFFSWTPSTDGGLTRRALGISEEAYGPYRNIQFQDGFTIVPYVPRPKSRGRIRLKSKDPFSPPLIFSNALKDPEDVDLLAEGALEAMRLGASRSFKAIDAKFHAGMLPACSGHLPFSKDYWECHSRHLTFNMFHDVGTAKMGTLDDPTSVVDSELRVFGVRNLRVMDASIMPQVVSTNTGAACMMIGEKGATMLRSYRKATRMDWPAKPGSRRIFNEPERLQDQQQQHEQELLLQQLQQQQELHEQQLLQQQVHQQQIQQYHLPTQPQPTTLGNWADWVEAQRNSTELPTTDKEQLNDTIFPILPEVTTETNENDIDIDGFHTFQSSWKLEHDRRSTLRFTDATEPVTQSADENVETDMEYSTEVPSPFDTGEKVRTTTPFTPADLWAQKVETAKPIIMSLAAVADVVTSSRAPIPTTTTLPSTTPPVSLEDTTPPLPPQVSAFIASQQAFTSDTTPYPEEDAFLPSLDKVDTDLDLVPVLPESWSPNMAFWYPEKTSRVERNRRSRLITYRH